MRGGAQRGVIERCWRDKKSKRRWLRRNKAAEREGDECYDINRGGE
jgi:hypothetical protein